MNDPAGYTMSGGRITRVDPVAVFFNGATGYEVPHMVLAAYMVAGGLAATPYAVGLARGVPKAVRPAAAIAVGAVICGWALAQYPYLLPPGMTVQAAAAPAGTEAAELVGLIVVLVGPAFALLFWLAQRPPG